jgi:hypothetical protein
MSRRKTKPPSNRMPPSEARSTALSPNAIYGITQSPDFDPTHVIVVVDLPAYPDLVGRSMPLEDALARINDVSTMLAICHGSIDELREQLAQTIAAGNTPIIEMWARGNRGRVELIGEVTYKRRPAPTDNCP